MVHDPAEQDAVKTGGGKRKIFDVAFQKVDVRIFGMTQGHELRTDIEPNRLVSLLVQQIGEDAGAAAEIGDAGAGAPPRQSHACVDQAHIALAA